MPRIRDHWLEQANRGGKPPGKLISQGECGRPDKEQGPCRSDWGVWSNLGLLALIAYTAYILGGFGLIFDDVAAGTAEAGPAAEAPGACLAVVAIDAVVSLALGAVLGRMGVFRTSSHKVRDLLNEMKPGQHFAFYLGLAAIEEVVFRWLLFGLPLHFFPGGFMALLLASNALFAAIHLPNFEDGWNPLKVLVQFVSGLFYAYVYVKFGLGAAILVHVGSNMLIFSSIKCQPVTTAYVAAGVLNAACAALVYVLMERPVTDVLAWFTLSAGAYPIPLVGYDFWDYLKLSCFLSFAIGAIRYGLAFDMNKVDAPPQDMTPGGAAWLLAAAVVVILGAMYAMYWLAGFVADVPLLRVFVASLVMSALSATRSPSNLASSFWFGLPAHMLGLTIYLCLPLSQAAALALASLLASYPFLCLKRLHMVECYEN